MRLGIVTRVRIGLTRFPSVNRNLLGLSGVLQISTTLTLEWDENMSVDSRDA